MKRINKQFKEDIQSLVSDYEKQSTGEIVPVILANSDSYPSAHFRWALLFSLLLPALLYMAPIPIQDPIWFLAIQAGGAILGLLLAFNHKAKRFMLTKGQMNEEVHQRALQAYFEHGVHTTNDRDGVLVFISLFERRAEIIADTGIAAKVNNDMWNTILKKALIDLKQGRIDTAMMGLVRETGELLTQHFSRKNELNGDIKQSELDDGLRTD